MKIINVYTDGACINNGKPNAKAGIGVYFGPNDNRNLSRTIPGKQTNNIAELVAIIFAIIRLKKEIEENKTINIYSDSLYAIRCFTTYGRRLEESGFQSSHPIPNIEIIKKGLELMRPNIHLKYVKSHTGLKNEHSIGNEMADRLAYQAIGKYLNKRMVRKYFEIRYEDREKAKGMGMRWDWKKKKWYKMVPIIS